MKCKKIQKLLLTDYIDAEVDRALKDEVENHLNNCHTCKRFGQNLLKTTVEPLKNAEKIKPPAIVWNQIKETLVFEERKKSDGFPVKFRNFLQRTLYMPKPAFALTTAIGVVLVLMITVTWFKTTGQRTVEMHREKQVEYLTYVMGDSKYFSNDENGEYSNDENDGYGTVIEEYFL